MPIFQITPLLGNSDAVSKAVQAHIAEEDRYALPGAAGWLVRHKGTSIEVSHVLEITGQPQGEKSPVGSAMVTLIAAYYGRGPSDLWEWLKTRFESEP